MNNIAEVIKMYMEDNRISYDDVAKKIGWSRQNLWDKLNKRSEPNLESMKKIADGLGFTFKLAKTNEPDKTKEAAALFEAVEMVQISYSDVEKILNSVGYSLIFIPPTR